MFQVTDILQKESPVNVSLSSKPIENGESRTIFFERSYRVESGLAIAAIRIPCTRSIRH